MPAGDLQQEEWRDESTVHHTTNESDDEGHLKMSDKLAACAWQLFEGAPGSDEQRAANSWLMQYQKCEEAWQASLELLRQPVLDPITHYPQVAPQLVALQILRLKIQQDWTKISVEQQDTLRQTLLLLLETACVTDTNVSTVSCRIACVTLADIVIKSFKSWTSWKRDVERLVNASTAAQKPQKGAAVLAGILGAIPLQILALERAARVEEIEEILSTFQTQLVDVLTVVQMIVTSIPNERLSALRCLESWIVGCIPTHEAFGLTAAHLFSCGLLDELFDIVLGDDEEQAQLAGAIIADSFAANTPIPALESVQKAVLHSGLRLINAMPVFQADTGSLMTEEHQISVCKAISRIACSLAMNHASVLFSKQKPLTPTSFENRFSPDQFERLSIDFIELLLVCSSHGNIDVAQPTLEIWFFFLETKLSQNEMSWQRLDVTVKEHVISVLSRLVNALIDQCKYPQWFVQRQLIGSDDPEIEAINDLRREIADTLLSLFSKWPGGGPDKPAGDYASCVLGMSQMLSTCQDVALIDALFFLLSYTVELFDPISSDSESEDDPDSVQDEPPVSRGIDVLLDVFDCTPNLPVHPLVINGLARYLQSLSASHALPPSVYLRASMPICQGLQCASSFPVAVQSLLQSSSSITKFTTLDERLPLLQLLLQRSSTLDTKTCQTTKGDLLEVTFRLAAGLSDTDFQALCSSSLSTFTIQVQSSNPSEASKSVYMLGRALGGVQDPQHGSALIAQLWPLVSASLSQHSLDSACRCHGVGFFLHAIPHLPREACNQVEGQILEICLWWYGKSLAPDILTCCSRLIARQRGNANFQATVEQTFERLVVDFRRKLHDVAGIDVSCGQLSMASFLCQHQELSSEIEQFFKLTNEVLSSFPHVLLQDGRNGEPALYWICLDLAIRLLKIDHQMQEVCDAACDFLLSAMRGQPEPIVERINVFATEVVRSVLSFLGPKGKHYRVRNFSDFLFQCLHAPQIPTQIRHGFLCAMSSVVAQGALRSDFSAEICQQMPNELRMRRQRHRFLQYFTRLARTAGEANNS